MKKNKKLIIGLASIILLASLILIIVLVVKNQKPSLEKQLKDLAVEYYENDYKELYPNFLKQWKEFKIDLDGLKGVKKDVSVFEEHKCDMTETYVLFTYEDDDTYKTEVHLSCEEE